MCYEALTHYPRVYSSLNSYLHTNLWSYSVIDRLKAHYGTLIEL